MFLAARSSVFSVGNIQMVLRQRGNLRTKSTKNYSRFFFPVTFLGLPELTEKKTMVDRSKPLPSSLQNEFIPEEVLLSLASAANAGPCPENLLPPKKTETPKVNIHIHRVLGNTCLLGIRLIKYLLSMLLLKTKIQLSQFEDLIGFLQQFVNQAASQMGSGKEF